MNWSSFLTHLQAKHPGEPQALAKIAHAVGMAKEGLQILTAMGHGFYLTAGAGFEAPNWPRPMFHVDAAPNGRLVNSEFELEELGSGWFDTLEKAQFWDGLDTQFSGRGGVARKGLPQVLGSISIDELMQFAAKQAAEKSARILEFKLARQRQKDDSTGVPASPASPPIEAVKKENVR